MGGFDKAWKLVAGPRDGEQVSLQLQPLVRDVYVQSLAQPLDRTAFKNSLEKLLEFLATDGRTNANCWAVDLFFMFSERWERDWTEQALPEDFHDVLALMEEALHDTVKDPDIAQNFGCLPEQLLERVRHISDE